MHSAPHHLEHVGILVEELQFLHHHLIFVLLPQKFLPRLVVLLDLCAKSSVPS